VAPGAGAATKAEETGADEFAPGATTRAEEAGADALEMVAGKEFPGAGAVAVKPITGMAEAPVVDADVGVGTLEADAATCVEVDPLEADIPKMLPGEVVVNIAFGVVVAGFLLARCVAN